MPDRLWEEMRLVSLSPTNSSPSRQPGDAAIPVVIAAHVGAMFLAAYLMTISRDRTVVSATTRMMKMP